MYQDGPLIFFYFCADFDKTEIKNSIIRLITFYLQNNNKHRHKTITFPLNHYNDDSKATKRKKVMFMILGLLAAFALYVCLCNDVYGQTRSL